MWCGGGGAGGGECGDDVNDVHHRPNIHFCVLYWPWSRSIIDSFHMYLRVLLLEFHVQTVSTCTCVYFY